jgi:hypothetical protein
MSLGGLGFFGGWEGAEDVFGANWKETKSLCWYS